MLEPAQAAVLAHVEHVVENPAVLLDARREGRTAGQAQARGAWRCAVCGAACDHRHARTCVTTPAVC